jgi:glutamyl-tRNA synthetase
MSLPTERPTGRVRVRFAPSPTGLLHVGNLRVALANVLFARRHAGTFILRFDDTDTQRGRPEYAEGIVQDLRWAGLEWDESFAQSDRLARYRLAAEQLKQSGLLYPCFESEEELRAKREQALRRHAAPIYDRAMLSLTAEQRAAAEANGKLPYWRFKLSGRTIEWRDLVLGARAVKLTSVSDPVLIRADGSFLYTFSSVVDDLESGISHVIRGEDHITNSGVQIDLLEALGASPARIRFAHLPLLTESDGSKLSKRLDALSLRSLARDGIEPMALTSYLARLGTSDDPAPMTLRELAAQFEFSRFSASAARFDIAQLLALNRRVLHAAEFAEVAGRLPAGTTETFWNAVRGNLDLLGEARSWWDVVSGSITPPALEGETEFLAVAEAALPGEPWDETIWKRWIEAVKTASGRRGRALFHPLRLALTGEESGPELAALLPLMGRTRVVERLRQGQGLCPAVLKHGTPLGA